MHVPPALPACGHGAAAIATTAAATTTTAAVNAICNQGVDIPYMAWLNLHTMLAYTISLHQHGLELDYFNEAALTDWCKHVSEEYGIECKTPKDHPKLKNPEDWFDFKEALYTWVLDKRGHSLDTPLVYLLHDYVSIRIITNTL